MNSRARTALLSAVSLAFVACAGNAGLRSKAARDFGCDRDSITAEVSGEHELHRVTGCGKDNVYFFKAVADEWTSPVDLAVKDMSCAKADLTTTPIDGQSVTVSGCGKKSVYIATFGAGGGDWKLQGESATPAPASSSAVAPPP